jgi:hypothetical protein
MKFMANIENILKNLTFEEKIKYYKNNNNQEKIKELVEEKINEPYNLDLTEKIALGLKYNLDKEKIKEKIEEEINNLKNMLLFPNKPFSELLQSQIRYKDFFDEKMIKKMYEVEKEVIPKIIIKSDIEDPIYHKSLHENILLLTKNDEIFKKEIIDEIINNSDEIVSSFYSVESPIQKMEMIKKNIDLNDDETMNLAKKFKESLIKQKKYYLAVELSETFDSLKDENFKELISKYIKKATSILGNIQNYFEIGGEIGADEETLLKYIENYKVQLDKAPKLYTKILKKEMLKSISSGIEYAKKIRAREETINDIMNWAISKNKSGRTLNYFLDANYFKLNNKSKEIIKERINSFDDCEYDYSGHVSGENPEKRVLEYYLQTEDNLEKKKEFSKKIFNSPDLRNNNDKLMNIVDYLIEEKVFNEKDIYNLSLNELNRGFFQGNYVDSITKLKNRFNLKEDFGKECYNRCIYNRWFKEAEEITDLFNLKEEKKAISSITKSLY